MTDIRLTSMAPGEFGVQIEEGDTTTSHVVRVPDGLLDDLAIPDLDHEMLVRESFEFLLEREKNTEIMPEFSLDQISRYFPEYSEEIRSRLGPR